MTKTFLVSFLAVLFVAGAALADPATDTVYVWYYDPAGPDTVWVSPGGTFELPVFIMTTPSAYTADIHLPLGVKDQFFDDIPIGCSSFGYPFDAWDDASFLATYEGSPPNPAGYSSRSFLGFADLGGPPNPWLFFATPTEALIFCVNAPIDDTLYLDSTYCDALQDGVSGTLGGPAAGDTLGTVGHAIVTAYPCVYFSPNQSPSVESVGEFDACTYRDFCVEVVIFDNDGDELTVDVNAGTIELVGTVGGPGEPTTYTYEWCFDMEDFCGQCFNGDLILTVDDGVNDPVVHNAGPLSVIGLMTASMEDSLYIWPGMEEWMPIYLDDCGDCFCLGGFKFTLEYDASVLTVTDVMPGAQIEDGEYFNVNYGQGWVNVVFVNDLNNQQAPPEVCDIEEPIFYVKFLLDPGPDYPIDFCIPICFVDSEDPYEAFNLNSVSDEGGYHTWFTHGCDDPPDSVEYGTMLLELECGNVKVMNEHNVVVGDLNLNGFPFEIGDAVLLANHLIDPAGYPFTLRQMFASDVNGDGIQASIADLIMMLNIINNNGGPGKLLPLDVIAAVSMPLEVTDNLEVRISSEAAIGGALVSINHTGVELGVPVVQGMDLQYVDDGDVMTVLVYSMESNSFAPGRNVLFTVPVENEGTISFGEVSASDNVGHLLDARAGLDAPIPVNFEVAQNFPNPFNARTTINFGLPVDADVTIAIYNVAGQLVESLNVGKRDAGFHSVVWDASEVASGVYFYRVTAGDYTETMKMTLLK